MLGFAALGQVALAQIPDSGDTGHAWRRWWIKDDYRHMLNRDAPKGFGWTEDDEVALVIALDL